MPGKQWSGSDKTYLYIIGGDICINSTQDTPGARRRDYETSAGIKGTKWELVYRSWEGIVRSLDFKDTDYGEQISIEFDDAILNMNTDSRYFSDFAKKLPSINIDEPIEIAPYDFETKEDKKRLIGLNIIQNGKKAENYYLDVTNGKAIHGFPVPIGNTKTYKSDDWKVFFISVKKFLVSEIQGMNMSWTDRRQKEEASNEQDRDAIFGSSLTTTKVDDGIPVIEPKSEDEAGVQLNKVPF